MIPFKARTSFCPLDPSESDCSLKLKTEGRVRFRVETPLAAPVHDSAGFSRPLPTMA
jgi:hypothetical protein